MNEKTELTDYVQECLSGERVFVYADFSEITDRLIDEAIKGGEAISHDWEYWRDLPDEMKRLSNELDESKHGA